MFKKITEKQLFFYLIIFSLIIINIFIINLLLKIPFFNQIKVAIISTFIPFLISFIIVYIFHPLLYWIEKRFSIKTWVTILTLITLYAIFIIVSIEFIIPLFAKQFYDIIIDFPNYLDQLDTLYNDLAIQYTILNSKDALELKDTAIHIIINNIGKMIVSSFTNLILFLWKTFWLFFIIPIIIFIMMVDYPRLLEKVSDFLVKHRKSEWITLLKNIDRQLGAYIRGQLIIISYMFIGTLIPLLIFGMPNAFVFSIIIAFTNLIPYIGPYLGGIPLVIYAYFQTPTLFIASIIIIIIMQQLDGNIGQPLVYGKQLKIHPIVIMIVMIIGGALGGILGLVASVPLYIILSETYKFTKIILKNPQS